MEGIGHWFEATQDDVQVWHGRHTMEILIWRPTPGFVSEKQAEEKNWNNDAMQPSKPL